LLINALKTWQNSSTW